jgi:hypothetical protein
MARSTVPPAASPDLIEKPFWETKAFVWQVVAVVLLVGIWLTGKLQDINAREQVNRQLAEDPHISSTLASMKAVVAKNAGGRVLLG